MTSPTPKIPPSASLEAGGGGAIGGGDAKTLQENLHVLLSRLAGTIEHVKNWPEGEASTHVESTTKLIDNINQVIASLQKVEGTVRADAALRKSLQGCQAPLDLLDLLDSSNLNPDCFSRGLLREALGQLAGLKRRKLALEMLGAAVQSGVNGRIQRRGRQRDPTEAEQGANAAAVSETVSEGGGGGNKKRPRSPPEGNDPGPMAEAEAASAGEKQPARKKLHIHISAKRGTGA